jgi:hypothetical protein
MMHGKRHWQVAELETPDELASKLTEYDWTGCTGFRLAGSRLVYLNDSTSADGAQEYGVVVAESGRQVESVTFGWMKKEEALETIRQYEGEIPNFDLGTVDPRQFAADAHRGPCCLCA